MRVKIATTEQSINHHTMFQHHSKSFTKILLQQRDLILSSLCVQISNDKHMSKEICILFIINKFQRLTFAILILFVFDYCSDIYHVNQPCNINTMATFQTVPFINEIKLFGFSYWDLYLLVLLLIL